jgi:cytoskeletal protein RodZ
MSEVTMVENRQKRAKNFWAGFGIGVVFMLIAVAIFWFLGLLDLFPASDIEQNTTNNLTETNNTVNLDNEDKDENDVNDADKNNDTDANDTDNDTDNDANNDTDNDAASSENSSAGVTLTVAKNVDDSAKAVDPTNEFTGDDDRFYVVVEFDSTVDLGEGSKVMVEWFKDDSALTDFEYELPESQRRVYFYQNAAGEGDYEVAISLDGKEVGRESFTVSK